MRLHLLFAALAAIGGLSAADSALAAGRSEPWQIGFQDAATPVMRDILAFNALLVPVVIAITVFVLVLLIYVMWKFSAKNNPTPSKTTHNTLLEVGWTTLPIILLVIIAIPSFKLMYFADRTTEAEMTLKIIGNQWYWSYEYPDNGDIAFDATFVEDDELEAGQPRLLTTDNYVVLPANTNIRLLMTSADVLHNWAVPSFGIKLDTVPGRLNETWVRVDEPGMYYGMCSELCGVNHGYMPISVQVVPKADFAAWVEKAKEQFAAGQPVERIELARNQDD